MSYSHFICCFPDRSDFYFNLIEPQQPDIIPPWCYVQTFPCACRIAGQNEGEFCQLAANMHLLVDYFSHIQSYEQGCIHVMETDLNNQTKELIVHKDAQNIFFYAVWLILIRSPCLGFPYHRKLREHYALTNDVKKIFYTLFSIFLVDAHFNDLERIGNIDNFKAQLQAFCEILSNLLGRMRQHFDQEADAAHNGLVLLTSLVQQVEIQMDTFYQELEFLVAR